MIGLSLAASFIEDLVSMELGFLTETSYYGNTLWQYTLFAIVFIGSFLLGKIIYFILKHKVTAAATKTSSQLDDIFLKIMKGPFTMAIIIMGLMLAVQFLSLQEGIINTLDNLFNVLISITVIWFFIRFVDIVIDVYLVPKAAKSETKLDEELIPVLKKVLKGLVLIFGFISIADNFGYDLTSLVAILGIAGLGISFAAKETIENMISGIIIYVDRPFKIGDRIKLDDNVYGDIVDVGLRSSKIKNLNNNIVIIPNRNMVSSFVENYTRPTKRIKKSFTIGLVYGTSPKKMEAAVKIITKAIKSTEGVTDDGPLVKFTEFGDSSLNLICIYWIKSLKYWAASHDINMKILKEFEKARLDIAFPTQTIRIEK